MRLYGVAVQVNNVQKQFSDKAAFHDTDIDTDTDILARMSVSVSVSVSMSVSWNADDHG